MTGVSRSTWVASAVLGVTAVVSLGISLSRADETSDLLRPLMSRPGSFDVFSPFVTGQPYLWLGVGVGLMVAAVAVLLAALAPGRRLWWVAALGAVAIAAGAYAQLERDSVNAALGADVVRDLGTFENQVFTGSVPVFSPFNVSSPYLWLGVAGALALGALAIAVSVSRTTPGRS